MYKDRTSPTDTRVFLMYIKWEVIHRTVHNIDEDIPYTYLAGIR